MTSTETRHDRGWALRRSRLLTRATLGWNLVELVVAISAGVAASSSALVGFGLDSAVESAASVVLLWRLGREDQPGCRRDDDRRAQRLIAVSLVALATLVTAEALRQLLTGARPEESVVGIALAAASLAVMPWLARRKRALAPALGSRAVEAESAQTMVCAQLSGALLVGLVANAALGWWWADPVAAIVIAGLAVREAKEAWTAESLEDTCCG